MGQTFVKKLSLDFPTRGPPSQLGAGSTIDGEGWSLPCLSVLQLSEFKGKM